MNFYIRIILLGVLFVSFSCTKGGGNIYVEGYVKNPLTGEVYSDVRIEIVKIKSFSLPGGYTSVKETTTDENGYFEISHVGSAQDYWVQINFDTKKYFGLGWNKNGSFRLSIIKGQNMYADYEMVPFGEFKFKIENVNCQGPSDYFKLYHYGSRFGYKEGLSDQALREGGGCYTYEQNYFAEVPAGGRYYRWEVTRNGTTQTYYDTFNVEPNQQKVFTIEY